MDLDFLVVVEQGDNIGACNALEHPLGVTDLFMLLQINISRELLVTKNTFKHFVINE